MIPLPFTSLPKNDSRGTAQQRILDLEVVILLYSYNPVQSHGTLETFTSLSKYRSSKSDISLKIPSINLDRIPGIGTLYGDAWQYLTRPTSHSLKLVQQKEIPQPRSIPWGDSHRQGGLLLEPYKTHRRVGAVFRRECPGIQTYFGFENKFRWSDLIYLLTKRRIGKTTRKINYFNKHIFDSIGTSPGRVMQAFK